MIFSPNPANNGQQLWTVIPLIKGKSCPPLLTAVSGYAVLPEMRFHDLRHTCATILLSKGVHAKFVQELLGHSTIAITMDTYSHVLPGMSDGLATAMDEALS